MRLFLQRVQNPFFILGSAFLLLAVYLMYVQVAEGASSSPQTALPETPAQLQAKYDQAGHGGPKVKVLIVPGHEPGYGGTEYLDRKEREINVAIANQLAAELGRDSHFEIVVARDNDAWNSIFASYFATQWDTIRTFVEEKKTVAASHVAQGSLLPLALQVSHNTAPDDVALRLYGITKWADENGVDMAIHIHLNDAGDRGTASPGSESGFAVYVPDSSSDNATTSRALGTSIASELNHYNATSSLAIENLGVTSDQQLIALGAYNTATYASVLIEYAYIYESKITSSVILPLVEADFANSTYRGVERFFGARIPYYDTLVLPHRFTSAPKLDTTSADTYALQTALHRIGLYPTNGEFYYDCPVAGYMGPCTEHAIVAFQKKNGIEQTGMLGPQTRRALNAIWAPK